MSSEFSNMPADLTTCDREPIHIPSRVQSFGALISLTPDWIINHASRNAAAALALSENNVVGSPVTEVLLDEAIHTIRGRLQLLGAADSVERIFGIQLTPSGNLKDVAVHLSGRSIVIEIEPHDDNMSMDYVGYVRPMIDRIKKADSVESLCKVASRQLRALVGFDRVMVYRFGEDGAGEVIAESLTGDMEPYLGLRYPASDIPKQAREMYKRNLLRIISDVSDTGVVVEPTTGPDGLPLDMTMSSTRAVSPIHLEYLKNMGVQASMSISILRRGKLWGLFACHHTTPRRLSYSKRTAAELFAQLFAFVLDQKAGDIAREDMLHARVLHDNIMIQLAEGGDINENLGLLSESIKSVVPFNGVATWVDGVYQSEGKAPTAEQFEPLSRILNTAPVSQIFCTDSISKVLPEAVAYADVASGMLALPVSRSPRDYLVIFREEVKKSVTWAGNPDKPVTKGEFGDRLNPRKSFEAWEQSVQAHSKPWTPSEQRTAEALRLTLLEVVLRMTDATVKERKKSQETQELLIAELNHRVRNILNLIRGLVSQSSDAKDVATFMDVVGGRIQALARAHDQITKENWTPASLYSLIDTEAKAYLGEQAPRIVMNGTDALLTPTAFTTVSLVMHEMMTNSAKYGALTDRHGQVEITLGTIGQGDLSIDWLERGGPPVKAPTRRGFGTTIIERSIPFELKGTATVDYELTGVKGAFTIPAEFIHGFADAKLAEEKAAPSFGAVQLSGTALVVEDNMIIALDAEDILLGLGASKVLMASSVSEALRFIEKEDIDFAVLDVNLGAETSEIVGMTLARQGTPFVFATGYGDRTALSEKFPTTKIVQKPYDKESVMAAIGAI